MPSVVVTVEVVVVSLVVEVVVSVVVVEVVVVVVVSVVVVVGVCVFYSICAKLGSVSPHQSQRFAVRYFGISPPADVHVKTLS